MQLTEAQVGSAQDSNPMLLDSLSRIVNLHAMIPGQFGSDTEVIPLSHFDSFSNSITGVRLDRTADDIADHFATTPERIAGEAGGGLIVDYGCGLSGYLLRLKDLGAEVLAIDTSVFMLDAQKDAGVPGMLAEGAKINLPDNSVSVLNASYSLPYWAQSTEHVSLFFDEINRVLVKPGGIAYIGSMVHMFLHKHWESAVYCDRQTPKSYHGLWSVDKPHFAATSLILSSFVEKLVQSNESGQVDLRLFRHWKHGAIRDLRSDQPEAHVPNFVRLETL